MTDSITVVGNIATAPEHKRTPTGVAITTFRVASGGRRYDRGLGKWVDADPNFYNVSAYRGLAEHAFRSLRIGQRVVLTGRLRVREWETSVKKGISIEIDADAIGHDLLFGTTTFEKDVAAGVSAPPEPAEEWPVAQLPGEGEEPGPSSPSLVLAGGAHGEDGDHAEVGDTPF